MAEPYVRSTAQKSEDPVGGGRDRVVFLEELEIAKALSLETLELDRIRRRRYMTSDESVNRTGTVDLSSTTIEKKYSDSTARSFNPLLRGHSTPSTESQIMNVDNKTNSFRGDDVNRRANEDHASKIPIKLDVRSRPRPITSRRTCGDVIMTLPPPPGKNPPRIPPSSSSSLSSELSDLMTFYSADNDKKNENSNLEELLDISFGRDSNITPGQPSADLFSSPVFKDLTPASTALSFSSFSNTITNSSFKNKYLTSVVPLGTHSPLFPTNIQSYTFTGKGSLSSSFDLSFPNSSVQHFPATLVPTWSSSSLSNNIRSQSTDSSSVPWFPFGSAVPAVSSIGQASIVNAPSASNTLSSVDVLKVIEKKANGNLIDLSYFDTIVMWGSTSSSALKTKDELLKSFDPLLDGSDELEANDATVDVHDESQTEVDQIDRSDDENEPQPPPVPLRRHSRTGVTFAEPDSENVEEIVQLRVPRGKTKDVLSRAVSYKRRCSRVYESIRILSNQKGSSLEIESFRDSLIRLRREFLFDDYHTNIGFVISPTLESLREETLSVRLVVYSTFTEKPISFKCDVTTSVEHAISQAVCTIFDDIRSINLDSYVLKVHGMAAYLSADSFLAEYEYIHQCHKFDEDVQLTLLNTSNLLRPLARTAQDDAVIHDIQVSSLLPMCGQAVSQQTLAILAETLEGEISRLREQAAKGYSFVLQPKGVIQAVKALCSTLASVETREVTEAVEDIQQVSLAFSRQPLDGDTQSNCAGDNELLMNVGARSISKLSKLLPNSPSVRMELLQLALERINEAIRSLLSMFCQGFQLDLKIPTPDNPTPSIKDITTFLDTVLLHVASVHRIPPQWASGFDYFVVSCELYHGTRLLCDVVETRPVMISSSFYEQIVFDEWVEVSGLLLCLLPREARLCCTLYGAKTVTSDSKTASETNGSQLVKVNLGWIAIQLFDHNGVMCQGSLLSGMWSGEMDRRLGPAISNVEDLHCPIMQVNLPDFGSIVLFSSVIENCPSQRKDFESLCSSDQQRLLNYVEKLSSPLCNVVEEREVLWDKRHYLYDIPQALPKVLLAAYSWDWACLADIYTMLHQWKAMDPLDALELLLPCFPDMEVRKMAISWLKEMGSDELCDYLPQLVQALKYETYLDSPTAWFLIERSLTSIRFMHHLYWLLKQNLDDIRSGRRILLILNSLMAIAGKSIREQVECQEKLMRNFSAIADKIKSTKDSLRLNILHHELESTHHLLESSPTCLPLSPCMEINGLDIKMCSYYTSNTLPLKLYCKSVESNAKPIEVLFKEGDDLRQDMITLQMIRIMDKLWLKEGLDLKVVTFACVPTANKKGMVEMIKGAETLRKIQTEHGLTGSFKDHPIAEWLQRHNPSESEYMQAVENFTLSCAGYSVATYVLGICDRHNDNIMLKTAGHIFHIDFGKFLGDTQMFGSIKRDRVPFVLTSDMAYVINVGDKPSSRFHNFVDLCCEAFNVIRRHGNLFLHLFALMVSSGIPGLTTEAVGYVQRALLLEMSDAEAAVHFSRMIEDSMKSWFTQFNFFMHNLAQLRFNGEQSTETLLSFIPKTFTMETDGKIRSVDVVAYQKRYEPEKVYMYILAVRRHGQQDTTYLFRSYREFCEFHQKLCSMFPLAKYKSLPRSLHLGRSNVRQVAEKRKDEVKNFLKSLWKTADEIKHCDLVYTFFHPLLRDQHEDLLHLSKVKDVSERSELHHEDGIPTGQLKLSLQYKEDTFFVMICHARNLSEVKGQTPDPYVKTYLIPDPTKATKRKTKVIRKNNHPTFMEMLIYRMPLQLVRQRVLQVSVWDYDRMAENAFLGSVEIALSFLDLTKETTNWYTLGHETSLSR